MKKHFPLLFLILFLFLFPAPALLSQSPQSIPYQAVVRNADGTAMSNAALTMIFRIHDQSATGTVVYEESHAINSNAQGLVICNVGNGTPTQGTFTNINWGSGAKFLHVLMDAGNGELDLGTQQMMSVPYALYAEKSGGSVPSGSAPGELMYWNGQGWTSIPPGGYGQALVMCDGVPTWGGCVPKLGEVVVNSYQWSPITDASTVNPNNVSFSCSFVSSGVLSNKSDVYGASGFILSDDSLFEQNVLNVEAYVMESYLNGAPVPIISLNGNLQLTPATTYYVKSFCNNSVGIGFSSVKSFITSQNIPGCIDATACNYNPLANYGAVCYYPGSGCDDGDASTIGSVVDENCECTGIVSTLFSQGNGVTDIDGNFYPSIIIENQEWMQTNLKVSKYLNGDSVLQNSPSNILDYTTPAYAIDVNDSSLSEIYGKWYNWYAVTDARGLCPEGWHVPTSDEWNNLRQFLGGAESAGTKLKSSVAWWYNPPNSYATNESGFTALPGGKIQSSLVLEGNGGLGAWWSSSFWAYQGSGYANCEYLISNSSVFSQSDLSIEQFLSVRCLKD